MQRLPRDHDHDYTREIAASRRQVVSQATNVPLTHVGSFSLDPTALPGHLEGFAGVAQVPLGFAGPLLVDGEHAQGEFYVPLATTEGTLVASYNRGMRLTREAGGVRTINILGLQRISAADRARRSSICMARAACRAGCPSSQSSPTISRSLRPIIRAMAAPTIPAGSKRFPTSLISILNS